MFLKLISSSFTSKALTKAFLFLPVRLQNVNEFTRYDRESARSVSDHLSSVWTCCTCPYSLMVRSHESAISSSFSPETVAQFAIAPDYLHSSLRWIESASCFAFWTSFTFFFILCISNYRLLICPTFDSGLHRLGEHGYEHGRNLISRKLRDKQCHIRTTSFYVFLLFSEAQIFAARLCGI